MNHAFTTYTFYMNFSPFIKGYLLEYLFLNFDVLQLRDFNGQKGHFPKNRL